MKVCKNFHCRAANNLKALKVETKGEECVLRVKENMTLSFSPFPKKYTPKIFSFSFTGGKKSSLTSHSGACFVKGA